MSKPSGAACNLDCQYCFFLSKRQLYPDSAFRMIGRCRRPTSGSAGGARAAREVVVAWQGGEPTMMGLDFFRRRIELEQRYARRASGFSTLADERHAAHRRLGRFLKENGFLVGILSTAHGTCTTPTASIRCRPTFDG